MRNFKKVQALVELYKKTSWNISEWLQFKILAG